MQNYPEGKELIALLIAGIEEIIGTVEGVDHPHDEPMEEDDILLKDSPPKEKCKCCLVQI